MISDNVRRVPCPRCGAGVGSGCRRPNGEPRGPHHQERHEAAADYDRPTRAELLEYALEGATTTRGVYSGVMGEDEEDLLDAHIAWLEAELEKQRNKDAKS